MTTYATCTGSIRTDSSGSWWNCSTVFVERSETEVIALLQAKGAITQESGTDAGLVLNDATVEGLTQAINQLNQVLEMPGMFQLPTAIELAQAFALGFSLPMIAYLVAWAFGSVIDFISDRVGSD